MPEIKKMVAYVPISREMALDAGLVEPTPEERVDAERSRKEGREKSDRYDRALKHFRTELDAVTDPVARAVLDLHECAEFSWESSPHCLGDDLNGYESEEPEWPCSTVATVATALGIHVPVWGE